MQGRDVFVSLPTGFGKSLCYAVLPLVFDCLRRKEGSIALCISPLTALMMEQRSKFTVKGIRAEYVGQLQQDILALAAIKNGEFQLLYVSPECTLTFCLLQYATRDKWSALANQNSRARVRV